MKQKFSESVAHVMEYIKFSEMGGEIDDTDPYYSTYETLRDLLWQVKDEEEILDEDTQTLIPAYLPEPLQKLDLHPDSKDGEKWEKGDFDVDMSQGLWDN